ncbi:MAG: FkbM family methyltransferase [Verrucomicrobia bacterium]|nr:FkbM family methyltransferase [Verrucomicrobiota bacterium]
MKQKLKALLNTCGLLGPIQRVRYAFRKPIATRDAVMLLARNLGMVLEFGGSQIVVRKRNREIRINPQHEVYLWDMINYFDYYHGAVFPSAANGVEIVDYSRPALHRLKKSGVEFEFPSLPESDESTEAYMTALGLKPGDVVLDLGAYAGASAYFLAKAVGPDGTVLSFEPDETNFRYLQAHIARHKLTNVRPVGKGVWSETTSLEFQAEGNMGSSAVSVLGRNTNVKVVEVLSLNDAVKLSGKESTRVAAIKMDIEGAEVAVVKSAGDFLLRHKPRLVIEPHFVNGRMCTEEICQLLRGYGYSVQLLTQGVQGWPLIAASPPMSQL